MRHEFDDDYAKGYLEPVDPIVHENKKRNVEYWDGLESEVEHALISVAAHGGVHIEDLKEYIDVKELTEEMIRRIQAQFPTAHFPYVDENY